jgi:hypothetical protein
VQRLKLAYLHETYGQKIMKSDPNGLKQEIESIRNNGIEFYHSHNNTSRPMPNKWDCSLSSVHRSVNFELCLIERHANIDFSIYNLIQFRYKQA